MNDSPQNGEVFVKEKYTISACSETKADKFKQLGFPRLECKNCVIFFQNYAILSKYTGKLSPNVV